MSKTIDLWYRASDMEKYTKCTVRGSTIRTVYDRKKCEERNDLKKGLLVVCETCFSCSFVGVITNIIWKRYGVIKDVNVFVLGMNRHSWATNPKHPASICKTDLCFIAPVQKTDEGLTYKFTTHIEEEDEDLLPLFDVDLHRKKRLEMVEQIQYNRNKDKICIACETGTKEGDRKVYCKKTQKTHYHRDVLVSKENVYMCVGVTEDHKVCDLENAELYDENAKYTENWYRSVIYDGVEVDNDPKIKMGQFIDLYKRYKTGWKEICELFNTVEPGISYKDFMVYITDPLKNIRQTDGKKGTKRDVWGLYKWFRIDKQLFDFFSQI